MALDGTRDGRTAEVTLVAVVTPPLVTSVIEDYAGGIPRVQEEYRGGRDAVLAEAAEAVLEAVGDRERIDNAEAAQIAPRLRRLVTRRTADLALVAQVIGAVDREAGLFTHPNRAERVPRMIAVEALLDAAEADVSVLGPEPVSAPESRVLHDDGSDDGVREIVPRRFGMTGRSFGGDISSWPRVHRLPPGRV